MLQKQECWGGICGVTRADGIQNEHIRGAVKVVEASLKAQEHSGTVMGGGEREWEGWRWTLRADLKREAQATMERPTQQKLQRDTAGGGGCDVPQPVKMTNRCGPDKN